MFKHLPAILTTLALLLIARYGYADTIYTQPNMSGGSINLTLESNPNLCNPPSFVAYSTTPNRPAQIGCWSIDKGTYEILVLWLGPQTDIRSYPLMDFDRTPYGDEVMNEHRRSKR